MLLQPSTCFLPTSVQEAALKKQVESSTGGESELTQLRQQLEEAVREKEDSERQSREKSASQEEERLRWVHRSHDSHMGVMYSHVHGLLTVV